MARTGVTVILIVAALLAGCATVPLSLTYSQDELRVICEGTAAGGIRAA